MILALILSLLPLSTPTSCPDLNGHYIKQGEDGRVHMRIVQEGCETISLEYFIYSHPDSSRTQHHFRLDGMAHPDGGWFGAPWSRPVQARFFGDTLALSAVPHDSIAEWNEARFNLLTSGELCVRFDEPPRAHFHAKTMGRVNGEGEAAENDAATRSDLGCEGQRT